MNIRTIAIAAVLSLTGSLAFAQTTVDPRPHANARLSYLTARVPRSWIPLEQFTMSKRRVSRQSSDRQRPAWYPARVISPGSVAKA
jgi:hypothetical protein